MATYICCARKIVGSITAATAQGSCTGAAGKPKTERYVLAKKTSKSAAKVATGRCAARNRAVTSPVASAWCVTSNGTIAIGLGNETPAAEFNIHTDPEADGAAHQRNGGDFWDNGRFAPYGRRDVGQRAGRNQRDIAVRVQQQLDE